MYRLKYYQQSIIFYIKQVFTKTFGIVKKLKELYSKIVGKLFGDKNAKKDHQDNPNCLATRTPKKTTKT
ncbi:hypothetical protein DDP57_08300, partial [Helicobacter pylori]|uniref:hypothetical protein n=1 Tax=Helicobacter pylori TaxID=210 RepID=UPI000F1C744E